MSTKFDLSWILILAFCLVLNHVVADFGLRIVGWVYLLPNHTYLHVFAWLPILSYLVWHFYGQHWKGYKAKFVAGIFILSGLVYFMAGSAQLYRAFITPFGLITIWISILFFKKASALLIANPANGRDYKSYSVIALGPILLLCASTIYIQPWSLVIRLPDVNGASLNGLDLRGMHFNIISFQDTDLSDVNFGNASLVGVKFENVTMDGANFNQANLDGVDFEEVSMVGVNFNKARLYQSNITDSNLSKANFNSAWVGRFYINKSRLCNTSFEKVFGRVYGWQNSIYGNNTIFPEDVDPEQEQMEFSLEC